MRIATLAGIGAALLCSVSAYAGSASYSFNSLSSTNGLDFGGSLWDGVTTSGTGSASIVASGGAGPFGSTTNGPVTGVMDDGFLQLTFADPTCTGNFSSSLCGGILFPDFDAGLVVAAFTFEADLRIGNGTPSPADGFSINYVRANDPVLLALQAGDTFPEMRSGISPHGGQFSDNGNPNDISLMEEGTQTGLSIGFDMWNSGSYTIPPVPPAVGRVAPGLTIDDIGLDIRVDGLLLTTIPMPNGTEGEGSTVPGSGTDPTSIETGPYDGTGCDSSLSWVHLKVVLDTAGQLSVYWKNTEILTNFPTSWYPSPGRLLMAARVGGATANIEVDNVQITTVPANSQVYPSFPIPQSSVPSLRSVEVHFYQDVTGVTATNLLINDVPAANMVAYAPWQYVFEFPEPAMGKVQVAWATNANIHSLAGQTNVPLGTGWSYTLDRLAPPPSLQITEFMAANKTTLLDEFGDSSDWIEIYNGTGNAVNLSGWSLTSQPTNLTQWVFPDYVLAAGDYLVVFASGRNLAAVTNELHTNFKLPAAGGFLALVDPQTNLVSCFGSAYPAQQTDISYGVDPVLLNAIGYYTTPTPGDPNSTTGPGFTAEPVFSKAGGTFLKPFALNVTAGTSNAVIRYTLDGTVPTDVSPVLSGPLTITNTVQVRARAFAPGLLPGLMHSETYIQLTADVAKIASDMPAVIIYNFGAGVPPAAEGTPDQFANFSFYEPTNGTTFLTNAPTLSSRAGFHVRGSSTRYYAKQAWTVNFWDELDNHLELSPLELPPGKNWVLYAPDNFEPVLIHNPLIYELSNEIGRYASRTRLLEVYINTAGGPVTTNDYNGIYVLEEKITLGEDRIDIPKLQPDDNTSPAVTGGYILRIDRLAPGENGFNAAGQTIVYDDPQESDILTPERAPQAQYIQNYMSTFWTALNSASYTSPALGYAAYIDVGSWIDHHILNVMAFNVDALRLSAYFYKPRQGQLIFGPIWDFDRSQGSTDGRDFSPFYWRAPIPDYGTDFFNYPWWGQMFTDIDFWQKWIDRYEDLRSSTLSTNHIYADIDALVAQVRQEEPREIARWSGFTTPRSGTVSISGYSYNFPGTYQGEVDFLKQWYRDRLYFMDTNLLARPVFSQNGGPVTPGLTLAMSGPTGARIYYCTDGSDPRLAGGALSPKALQYSSPIAIPTNMVIKARAFNSNHQNLTGANNPPLSSPWSGYTTANFGLVTDPSQIVYAAAGAVYTQNFDSLPDPGSTSVDSGNPVTINGVTYFLANPFGLAFPVNSSGVTGGLGLANTMPGWYGLADPTASVGTRFGATDGDQTTGGLISFGLPNSGNRALGLLATSTTGYTAFGAKFVNGTGQTLNFINLQFTGEVWRQSDKAKTLECYYFIDPSATNAFSTNATAFLPALNVSFPSVPADVGGVAVDGTSVLNQTNLDVVNQVITNWVPGAALCLVWEMASADGKSQGLAIDNLSFSASAWPTGMSSPRLLAELNGTNLVLSVPSIAGLRYEMQFRTNLTSAPWLPMSAVIPGTGAPLTFTNSLAPFAECFYRLMVEPQ